MKGTQYHQASRGIKMEVHIFFDGIGQPPMIITPDDYLVSLKIIEESSAPGEHPIGQVSSNMVDLTLYNTDDIFTPQESEGSAGAKILPELPIKIYCYEESAPEDVTFMGTFYVADWKANSGSSLAEITAYDKLARYLRMDTPTISISKDTTLGDFIVNLFAGVAVTKEQLDLDPNLFTTYMPFAFVTEKEFGTVLQLLSEAYLLYIDVSRQEKIRVKRLASIAEVPVDIWDDDFVIETALQYDMLKAYNEIVVVYSKYIESEAQSLATIKDLQLGMYTTEVRGIVPSQGPIFNLQCLQGTLPSGVYPLRFVYAPWEINFDLFNKYSPCDLGEINIWGTYLDTMTTTTYRLSDQTSVTRIGSRPFEYKNIYLMQEKEVQEGAQLLLSHCINNNTIRTSSVRGNPEVAPGEVILRQGATTTLELVQSQELEYDGSLSCQVTTRVLQEVDVNDYV